MTSNGPPSGQYAGSSANNHNGSRGQSHYHNNGRSGNHPSHTRRVWIRRPGQVATTVTVHENDIVDDLKSMILMKYPTSLARTCDPADIVIKYLDHHTSSTKKSNRKGHANHEQYPQQSSADQTQNNNKQKQPGPISPLELVLQPDEIVFEVYNELFPQGMTMRDAFMVEVGRPLTEFPISPPNGIILPNMMESLATDKDTLKHSASDVDITAPRSYIGVQPTVSGHILPGANDDARSVRSSVSTASSSSHRTSTGNNGVLLLPRQFQLPTQSGQPTHREDDHDDSIGASRQNTNAEPSPVTPYPSNSSDNTLTSDVNQNQKPKSDEQKSPAQAPQQLQQQTGQEKPSIQKVKSMKKSTTASLSLREGVVPQINVLIVEDNVINQKILEAFMRRKHIRCEVAKNGKEAVEKWRQGGFHLVLMDIQLPVMSGIEAAKEIRRLEHVNYIGAFSSEERQANQQTISTADKLDSILFKSPVIIVALTASSSSADKSEALAAGCNDFLTKPVSLIWLEQKTIEWGCMQALIDFEGWKNWVTRSDDHRTNKRSSSMSRSMKGNKQRSRSRTRARSKNRVETPSTTASSAPTSAVTAGAASPLSPLTVVTNSNSL